MRRTVLSAVALAATAVLAGTAPAFADDVTPTAVPSTAPTQDTQPTTAPTEAPAPAGEATPVPGDAPGKDAPTRAPAQVAEVPQGAPNTGVTETSTDSGTPGALIGGGAAAAFAVGGAAVFVVRRRRATGA
ncbi:sortase-dependent protein [Streptomyces sp. NPDC005474]|uniref:sortase-dependent protein n=1 Tax=Streptomyces sp. NPDC005474 TaxID=3154878 RepID=UPI003452E93F